MAYGLSIGEACYKAHTQFDYKNLETSIKYLLCNISEAFDAKSVMLFKKGRDSFFLYSSSNDLFLEEINTFIDYCNNQVKDYKKGISSSEIKIEDKTSSENDKKNETRIILIHLFIGQDEYTFSILNGKRLDESEALIKTFINKTVRKLIEDSKILKVNLVDQMTSLKTRDALAERIRMIKEADSHQVTVIFGDIYDLKYINDKYKHDGGDKYIIGVSGQLRNSFGESAEMFRYGGDEIVIIFDKEPEDDVATKIEEVRVAVEAMDDPLALCGDGKSSSYRFGNDNTGFDAAYAVGDSKDIEELIKEADSKMYAVKKAHHERPECDKRKRKTQ